MRIINITDLSAPELDIYARMSENQLAHIYEPASGLFIAESPKVIERALDAGYEPVSILLEDRHVEGQCADIIKRCGDIPIYTAPFDVLTKLTGFALTRGMLCAMRRAELPSVESVCEHAARIAVLEEVMNPTNVGAIFRSAAALGMDAVLLTPGCSDPLYRRAVRVSMGTVFQIPWTYITFDTLGLAHNKADHGIWPEFGMEQLHSMGFRTASMALRNDTIDIHDPELKQIDRLAVILGTEGEGLKRDHRFQRLHSEDTNVSRSGQPECGCSQCRGILGTWQTLMKRRKTSLKKYAYISTGYGKYVIIVRT